MSSSFYPFPSRSPNFHRILPETPLHTSSLRLWPFLSIFPIQPHYPSLYFSAPSNSSHSTPATAPRPQTSPASPRLPSQPTAPPSRPSLAPGPRAPHALRREALSLRAPAGFGQTRPPGASPSPILRPPTAARSFPPSLAAPPGPSLLRSSALPPSPSSSLLPSPSPERPPSAVRFPVRVAGRAAQPVRLPARS
ncbi:proline-rich protein 36-like, partial [Cricetulus griseus]|uniref:proline-rich protein 36-like n=1 Tax=Cricetulus griseus TaxID=10029 RepID=UPI0015C3095B